MYRVFEIANFVKLNRRLKNMIRNTITNLLLAVIIFSATGCVTDPAEDIREKALNDKEFLTEIAWDQTEKDLGSIEEGQKLEVVFTFTNKGKKPLVIKTVQATCGCTVPEVPKEPVMPGNKGLIKAVFDSQGRSGSNHKTITVQANTKPQESFQLNFNVEVKPKPAKEGEPAKK